MPRIWKHSGRTSSIRMSASRKYVKGDGRVQSSISGQKANLVISHTVTRMQRLEHLLRIMNSIGDVGDNLLERFLKLTLVNYGRSQYQQKPSNKQDMERVAKPSHVNVQVSYLPMLLAEKIETCPTFVFGQIILQNLRKNTECHQNHGTLSWMQ